MLRWLESSSPGSCLSLSVSVFCNRVSPRCLSDFWAKLLRARKDTSTVQKIADTFLHGYARKHCGAFVITESFGSTEKLLPVPCVLGAHAAFQDLLSRGQRPRSSPLEPKATHAGQLLVTHGRPANHYPQGATTSALIPTGRAGEDDDWLM